MKLTQTLLGYLNRVFSRDPQKFLGIQFSYAGTGMTWTVAEGVLTVAVTGGIGAGFTLALSAYTIASLASHISALPGYTVSASASSDLSGMSAMVLLDGAGDQNVTGGRNLYAYGNVLYAYLESAAIELNTAESAVVEALKQPQIFDENGNLSASGSWQDEIGSYFDVPRLSAEPDTVYGPRIPAEVLRPRGNNVALEVAIKAFTGQDVTVTDVATPGFSDPTHNSLYTHNGTAHYNSTGSFQYNLFDVVVGYDAVGGGDRPTFQANITAVVDRLRDAGTHMRSLVLGGSRIADTYAVAPSDTFAGIVVSPHLADTFTGPTDGGVVLSNGGAPFSEIFTPGNDATSSLVATYTTVYGGAHHYDGKIPHMGGHYSTSNLDGSGLTVT